MRQVGWVQGIVWGLTGGKRGGRGRREGKLLYVVREDRQTVRDVKIETDRQTYRQTDRQTGTQADNTYERSQWSSVHLRYR